MTKGFSSIILAIVMVITPIANAGLIELPDEYLENSSSVTFNVTAESFDPINASANFANALQLSEVQGDLFSHIFDGEFGNIGIVAPSTQAMFNTTSGNHSLNIDLFYVAGLSFEGFIDATLTSMYNIIQFDNDFLRGNIIEGSSFQFMSKAFDITGSIFMANDHANGEATGEITLNYLVTDKEPSSPVVDVPEPATLVIFGLGIIGLIFRRTKIQ